MLYQSTIPVYEERSYGLVNHRRGGFETGIRHGADDEAVYAVRS